MRLNKKELLLILFCLQQLFHIHLTIEERVSFNLIASFEIYTSSWIFRRWSSWAQWTNWQLTHIMNFKLCTLLFVVTGMEISLKKLKWWNQFVAVTDSRSVRDIRFRVSDRTKEWGVTRRTPEALPFYTDVEMFWRLVFALVTHTTVS